METQKFRFFLQNSLKFNFDLHFDLCQRAEMTLTMSMSVLHWQLIHQWKGFHKYFNMETPKFEFFQKCSKLNFEF